MKKMVISAVAMCASALLFAGNAAAGGNDLLVYTAADDGKLHAALTDA